MKSISNTIIAFNIGLIFFNITLYANQTTENNTQSQQPVQQVQLQQNNHDKISESPTTETVIKNNAPEVIKQFGKVIGSFLKMLNKPHAEHVGNAVEGIFNATSLLTARSPEITQCITEYLHTEEGQQDLDELKKTVRSINYEDLSQ